MRVLRPHTVIALPAPVTRVAAGQAPLTVPLYNDLDKIVHTSLAWEMSREGLLQSSLKKPMLIP